MVYNLFQVLKNNEIEYHKLTNIITIRGKKNFVQ